MAKLTPQSNLARRVNDKLAVVHEAAPGGMRKMRCPGSHQLAVPAITRDGQRVLRAPNGTSYVTRPMK